jgi:hypothetical protein
LETWIALPVINDFAPHADAQNSEELTGCDLQYSCKAKKFARADSVKDLTAHMRPKVAMKTPATAVGLQPLRIKDLIFPNSGSGGRGVFEITGEEGRDCTVFAAAVADVGDVVMPADTDATGATDEVVVGVNGTAVRAGHCLVCCSPIA